MQYYLLLKPIDDPNNPVVTSRAGIRGNIHSNVRSVDKITSQLHHSVTLSHPYSHRPQQLDKCLLYRKGQVYLDLVGTVLGFRLIAQIS